MSETTGGLFTTVTVNVAASLSLKPPRSVAVNVIASEPVQSAEGVLIVATLLTMLTVKSVFPE